MEAISDGDPTVMQPQDSEIAQVEVITDNSGPVMMINVSVQRTETSLGMRGSLSLSFHVVFH